MTLKAHGAPSVVGAGDETRNSEKLKRLVRLLLDAVPLLEEKDADPIIHAICREFSRRELTALADNDFRYEVANAIWDEWESWNAPDNWFPESLTLYKHIPKDSEDN